MNKIYFAIDIFAIVLGGYFVLSFLAQDSSYEQYVITESLRLDPYELNVYPSQPDMSKRDLNKPLVVFFGDSRATAWTAIANTSFEFINRGIDGQTTNQVLGRVSAHVATLSPNIVVVQVGVNLLGRIASFPNESRNIISKCKQNIQKIVDKLAQELQTTVILTTIFPTAQSLQAPWSNDLDLAIIEVNQFIKSLNSDRVIIMDAAMLLADERSKVRQIYSQDFLHLNEVGYTMLNDELSKILSDRVR